MTMLQLRHAMMMSLQKCTLDEDVNREDEMAEIKPSCLEKFRKYAWRNVSDANILKYQEFSQEGLKLNFDFLG